MAHDHDSNNFETSDQFLYCNDRLSGFSLALTDSVNPCIIRKTNNNKTIVITVLKWKCKYFDFLKKKVYNYLEWNQFIICGALTRLLSCVGNTKEEETHDPILTKTTF